MGFVYTLNAYETNFVIVLYFYYRYQNAVNAFLLTRFSAIFIAFFVFSRVFYWVYFFFFVRDTQHPDPNYTCTTAVCTSRLVRPSVRRRRRRRVARALFDSGGGGGVVDS